MYIRRHASASRAALATLWALVGCFGPFDQYSPSRIHSTVQGDGQGAFTIEYPWASVRKEFGADLPTALTGYMRAKGIMPPECADGIVIVAGQHLEGGGAWARFRCLEPPA